MSDSAAENVDNGTSPPPQLDVAEKFMKEVVYDKMEGRGTFDAFCSCDGLSLTEVGSGAYIGLKC